MKATYFLLILVAFAGCKKHKTDKVYTIQGQVLESTSNPVPVTNYKLHIYQKDVGGLLGGVYGADETTITGSDGRFKFEYNPGRNYGFSLAGTNTEKISVVGVDSFKYNELFPTWRPVDAGIDADLKIIYLYKNIQFLVRKVQFNNALNAGETLEVITPDSSRSSHKYVNGPIAAGTLLVVDTIRNCKLSSFNLATNSYDFTMTLQKPSYLTYTAFHLPVGDEIIRELLVNY